MDDTHKSSKNSPQFSFPSLRFLFSDKLLVLDSRASTMDVDGLFKPSAIVRKFAKQVGKEFGIDENWLNDGVKGFFSDKGQFNDFLELTNLTIYTATPEYLLAMKCLAMLIGAEFHDISDIQYLLRYLNIETYIQAREVIKQYYPLERFPQKTLYAIEEMLGDSTTMD
ncbi:MAG: hypothetical protein L3J83_01410 [Proteobacteria bacterium]|nr:hypothetical protein [Pseudomonadota bacterium]